jgi:hypothetical protein
MNIKKLIPIITGIVVIVIAGILVTKNNRSSLIETTTPTTDTLPTASTTPSDVVKPKPVDTTPVVYKNDQLGFSFSYPHYLGTFTLSIDTVGQGNSINGKLCTTGTGFCMTAGGVTPTTFMQIGANGLMKYPSVADRAELEKSGYLSETKVNAQGVEYLLIHGKKEIDTHYIGENQAVVVFKLPTPPNFNVVGFMLETGDMKTFLKIMDSVKTY